MQNEISSGAMLGIVLIAIAAVLGLGFGTFAIARTTANSGSSDVQDKLNQSTELIFEDYNKRVVTGISILSAIDKFIDKDVAILIQTVALSETIYAHNVEPSDISELYHNSGIERAYKCDKTPDAKMTLPIIFGFEDESLSEEKVHMSETGSYQLVRTAFFNYGAVLGSSVLSKDVLDLNINISKKDYYLGANYFENGEWYTTSGFIANENGTVQHNGLVTNLKAKGNLEYVDPNAKFNAFLLKDGSGTIVGIVFQQIVV